MMGSMPFTAKSFVVGRKDWETLRQWIRSPTMLLALVETCAFLSGEG